MKDLIMLFVNDYRQEQFTRKEFIKYGLLAPIAFIAGCIIAG